MPKEVSTTDAGYLDEICGLAISGLRINRCYPCRWESNSFLPADDFLRMKMKVTFRKYEGTKVCDVN